jgi:hypothetical protein
MLKYVVFLVTTAFINTLISEHHIVVRIYSRQVHGHFNIVAAYINRMLTLRMIHFNIILMSTSRSSQHCYHFFNSVFPLYLVVNMLMRFEVSTPSSVNSFLVRCDVMHFDRIAPYFQKNMLSPDNVLP